MPIYSAIVGGIVGTIYFIITGFPILPVQDALIILTTGMLSIWGLAIYFKALMLEETSRIIIFFKAIPVFVLILSTLFLKESISIPQLTGFILILISVSGVSMKQNQRVSPKNFFASGLGLILLVDVLWAISAILVKFTISQHSFASIISYESWGVSLGGLLLYICVPTIRDAFHYTQHSVTKRAIVFIFGNEFLFVLSRAVTFYAYSLGPASLVSVVGTSQVFYGILLGFLLSKLHPSVYEEDTTSKSIYAKFFWGIVLLVGIYLIT